MSGENVESTPAIESRARRVPSDQRREMVLDAAFDLFAEGGPGAITMEELARVLNVGKPIIYRLFANSDDVLGALISRETRRSAAMLASFIPADEEYSDPLNATTEALLAHLDSVRAHPTRFKILALGPTLARGGLGATHGRARQRMIDQLAALAEQAFADRPGGPLDPQLTAHLIAAGLEEHSRLILEQPDLYPPERMRSFVREVVRLFLQG